MKMLFLKKFLRLRGFRKSFAHKIIDNLSG